MALLSVLDSYSHRGFSPVITEFYESSEPFQRFASALGFDKDLKPLKRFG